MVSRKSGISPRILQYFTASTFRPAPCGCRRECRWIVAGLEILGYMGPSPATAPSLRTGEDDGNSECHAVPFRYLMLAAAFSGAFALCGCRDRASDMDDARRAVAASLSSTGPLQFRGMRVDESGGSSFVCGEVKDGQADYRAFAYGVSTGRAFILPAKVSSGANMVVTSDFPDDCIPDADHQGIETPGQTV